MGMSYQGGKAATVTTNANLTGGVTSVGNAATVITNANLTGAVTSIGNAASLGSFSSANLATALTDETGSGAAVFANSPTFVTPALGTPASGVATNLTGTASGLTAGTVTTNANLTGSVTSIGNATTVITNANLTGEVTSTGNATTLTNSAAIGKVLTGLSATNGAVVATDTILQGFNKLQGNSPVTQGNGSQKIITPYLPPGSSGLLLTSGTSYASYMGFFTQDSVVNYARAQISSSAVGTQTAEIGLFSSPSPPNSANQVLTKIIATGTLDDLTAQGLKGNTSSFSQTITAGTNLWVVIRTAMSMTQPNFYGTAFDMSSGALLKTAATGTLTGLSSFTGTIIALSANSVVPLFTLFLN